MASTQKTPVSSAPKERHGMTDTELLDWVDRVGGARGLNLVVWPATRGEPAKFRVLLPGASSYAGRGYTLREALEDAYHVATGNP